MEKRALHRIAMDGLVVHYKKSSNKFLFRPYKKEAVLKDISKSGLGMVTHEQLQKGDLLQMRIEFIETKPLTVKGRIRWSQPSENNGHYRVGIQFLPFGEYSQYNSLTALQQLRELSGQSMVMTA
ncbi:MAG: hypothetical protein GF313_07985 [Caldithrix sp.]|nr:hypothetical protein [Caldithrix sp.]